jgi:hypothetical protein
VAIFLKDPAATLDYAVDWQAVYLDGQTIIQSQWRVAPDTVDGMTVTHAGQVGGRTVVTLAGGQRGTLYRITNRVTLSDGRSDERSLDVRVEDR